MAHTFEFAIIRAVSNDSRDERLNVGIAVICDHSIDIRYSNRLDKLHAMSAGLHADAVKALLESVKATNQLISDQVVPDCKSRLKLFFAGGPVALSDFGTFSLDNAADYETRISHILKRMVDPEPAMVRPKPKRSRLLTDVKRVFRDERILAKKGETLESHRIVAHYEIASGLVADLALKNGKMHFIETVDASGDIESMRRAVSDFGLAALVLARGRMEHKSAATRLVYNASSALEAAAKASLDVASSQGADLVNWASAVDRDRFVQAFAASATPLPDKKYGRRRGVSFVTGERLI